MSYKVTLPKAFSYDQRRRAGITVSREGGYEGDLTAEQLKAVKADPLLSVSEVLTDEEKARRKAEADAKKKADAEPKAKAEADAKKAAGQS